MEKFRSMERYQSIDNRGRVVLAEETRRTPDGVTEKLRVVHEYDDITGEVKSMKAWIDDELIRTGEKFNHQDSSGGSVSEFITYVYRDGVENPSIDDIDRVIMHPNGYRTIQRFHNSSIKGSEPALFDEVTYYPRDNDNGSDKLYRHRYSDGTTKIYDRKGNMTHDISSQFINVITYDRFNRPVKWYNKAKWGNGGYYLKIAEFDYDDRFEPTKPYIRPILDDIFGYDYNDSAFTISNCNIMYITKKSIKSVEYYNGEYTEDDTLIDTWEYDDKGRIVRHDHNNGLWCQYEYKDFSDGSSMFYYKDNGYENCEDTTGFSLSDAYGELVDELGYEGV